MKERFSWDKSASKYEKLYKLALLKRDLKNE
jgi:glycogen synthase